jgi:hypothetical protein
VRALSITHKGSVDLDLIQRQLLDVSQRRIAGAKIIHRESDIFAALFQANKAHILSTTAL